MSDSGDTILQTDSEKYHVLLNTISEGVFFHERGRIYEVNQVLADMLGYPVEELFERRIFDIVAPESRRKAAEHIRAEDENPYELILRKKDGTEFPVQVLARSARLGDHVIRVVKIVDLTEQKRSQELIEEQNRAILEMSTPVIRVRLGVVLVPIVGVLDTARSARLTETVLASVAEHEAHVVIIDVTGVPAMDTSVARHLVSTVDAVRILGAESIVTGFGPQAAQTLAELGVDLTSLRTMGSLERGIDEAFRIVTTNGDHR